MSINTEFDKIFCLYGKKYALPKLFLKAVGMVESNLNTRAYRFEPKFWEVYLAKNPEWQNRNPELVSASFGICQIMFTTSAMLGLTGNSDEEIAESLYNPVININLGAKLLKKIHEKTIKEERLDIKYCLNKWAICAARYNGGSIKNPDDQGKLRNQLYVDKIFKIWYDLRQIENECPDE